MADIKYGKNGCMKIINKLSGTIGSSFNRDLQIIKSVNMSGYTYVFIVLNAKILRP